MHQWKRASIEVIWGKNGASRYEEKESLALLVSNEIVSINTKVVRIQSA